MGWAERANKSHNPTCIIQARMGSTRLPGKVLSVIAGKPALQRVIERVRLASEIKQVVVAVPDIAESDRIIALCDSLGADFFCGPENDVLYRHVQAAEHFDAQPIVRVTGDCPLIDPGVLNVLVRTQRENPDVFVANNLERTFPLGLDAECFSIELLRDALAQKGDDYDAEHVTGWLRRQPGAINLRSPKDLSHIRLTLDTKDDLTALRAIYRAFAGKDYVSTADVLWLLERRPEIAELTRAA